MSLRVGICMGSRSDLPVMTKAAEVLESFGVEHEVRIISAHRTPQALYDYGASATERGVQVIIAGAGGAAHLPGMLAALTSAPVVGVPVGLRHLDGLDSLLSIVQMPRGTPVATVGIDNATNAAFLAMRMLGIADGELRGRLDAYRQDKARIVEEDDALLKEQGVASS